jgi:hypothetical protein
MPDRLRKEVSFSGIASDALARLRSLAHETAELFRQFAESSHARGEIRVLLIAGAGTVFVSAVLLSEMFVKLLASMIPDQPEWIAYGAIGVPVLGVGVALIAVARRRMKRLDPLQEQSVKVMQDATETFEHAGQAVDAARQSLHESAVSVREALDVSEQFKKRPWTMLGAAVSLSYVGGTLMQNNGSPRRAPDSAGSNKGSGPGDGALAHLARQFAPELNQLRGLAIAALFGFVHDLAAKSLPQRVEGELEDVIDDITVKLGVATAARGPVLGPSASSNGSSPATR